MELVLNTDGEVTLYRSWLKNSNDLFASLNSEVPWKHDLVQIFGKTITTKRQVCWMAESLVEYRYSGIVKKAITWHPSIRELAEQLHSEFGFKYNSCLLNLYQNGLEGMGYHSDDEPELDQDTPIASLSLGSNRPFFFKHKKSGEREEVELRSGDLLLMDHRNQLHWRHSLPIRKRIMEPRINLTFRRLRDISTA